MTSGNWQLALCGINHKTSTLEEREPLQIGPEDFARANATLCNIEGVAEAAILSTCNRIELFTVARSDLKPVDIATAFYREFKNIDPTGMENKFYSLTDSDVADHLFRVATGIDSMVIGENQIFGQVKEAYSSACRVKTAGKVIHGLFHHAFRVGKQVRASTELGQGACSVSSATVELLKSKMSGLTTPTILFVGINQMIVLAAAGFHKRGDDNFIFANRTRQKALDLAVRYKAQGHGLDELPELLHKADVVVCCTGSKRPLITDDMISARAASDRPLIIADMAIPRDVELQKDYTGIELYDLENVKEFVKDSRAQRIKAIPQAEALIKYRLEQFVYWYEHVRNEPGYNGLGEAFELARRQEMSKVLGQIPEENRDLIDRATRRLTEKLLQIKLRTSAQAEKTE